MKHLLSFLPPLLREKGQHGHVAGQGHRLKDLGLPFKERGAAPDIDKDL